MRNLLLYALRKFGRGLRISPNPLRRKQERQDKEKGMKPECRRETHLQKSYPIDPISNSG
jgi:hypothetical protein